MITPTTNGSSPSATQLSQAAERYEFVRLTSNGRTGALYEAADRMGGDAYMLKLLALNLPYKKVRSEFVKRAKALVNLREPTIAQAVDYGYHYGLAYLVSDAVPGITLEEYLERRGPLKWKQAVPLLARILTALSAAHEHGLVHGDVQPSHIMLKNDGSLITDVVLCGFGFPDLLKDETSAVADTRHVSVVEAIAPERLLKQGCDHRLDLYALGALTYELLSGKRPFGAASVERVFQSLYEPPEALSAAMPRGRTIPPELEAWVNHLLQKSPTDRPMTAGDALTELEDATGIRNVAVVRAQISVPSAARIAAPSADDVAAARPRAAAAVQPTPAAAAPDTTAPQAQPSAAPNNLNSWIPSPQLVVQVTVLLLAFSLFAGLGSAIVLLIRGDSEPAPLPQPAPPPIVQPVTVSEPDDQEIHSLFSRVGRALDAQEYGKARDLLDRVGSRPGFPKELRGTLEAYRSRLDLNSQLAKAKRLEDSGKTEEALLIYGELEEKYPHHTLPDRAGALSGAFVLEVSSNVAAVVSVDDEPVGITPFTGLIPIEAREISVTRTGYRTWSKAVAAQEGGRLVLQADLRRRARGERPTRREVNLEASPFMDLMEMKVR